MYLVCLHPDNKNKNFERIKVGILKEELENLFKERLEMLNKK